jgi:hypothetical protein
MVGMTTVSSIGSARTAPAGSRYSAWERLRANAVPPAIAAMSSSPAASTPIELPSPEVAAVVIASRPEGLWSPLAAGAPLPPFPLPPRVPPAVPVPLPPVAPEPDEPCAAVDVGAPNADEVATASSCFASAPPRLAIC